MTTLIAIQHDDWCVIAADSQSTANFRAFDTSPVGKINKNKNILIAAAGSGRGANILAFDWNPPTPSGDLDVFITKQLIPSMRKKFIESGYDIKSDGESSSFDNELLIAMKGTIYHIFEDYSWERCGTKVYATGSGGDYALGALNALDVTLCDDYEEAIDIAEQAVKIATRLDVFSGGHIQVAVQNRQGKSLVGTITD
jgi:ATP-dependent protease HslVU (ClpYQ) peptidase subunit